MTLRKTDSSFNACLAKSKTKDERVQLQAAIVSESVVAIVAGVVGAETGMDKR